MAEIAMTELWDRCRTQFHVIYHNYQQAAAGTGIMLEAEDSGEPVFIRNTRLSDRADEIVTVNGASMEPDFHDGQDVYVEHTPDLEIGEIGLFVVNGDGFIKQYQGDHLHSLNPEYDDIQLSEFDESRTVGRVLGVVEESDYPTREEQAVLAEIQREKKK
jgi:repressor LexA